MLRIKDNPWLGLASYENQDSYRFFGRDNDITELENAISDNLFTIIYGITGAGKTSLINAGLSPRLANNNYLPVRLRLDHCSTLGYNTQIIQALQTAITTIHGEIERFNPNRSLGFLSVVWQREILYFFPNSKKGLPCF